MVRTMVADQLGPFQDIWTAWDASNDAILNKPISHFREATLHQFKELEQHSKDDLRQKAAYEAIDIISIALNLLRSLEYTPAEIADLARSRARRRMSGQTEAILQKYKDLYGI